MKIINIEEENTIDEDLIPYYKCKVCKRRVCKDEYSPKTKTCIYCEDVDGGVSGRGYFVIVNIKTLKKAIEKVKNSKFDEEDKEDYLSFLRKCVKYCKDNKKEGIIISFG